MTDNISKELIKELRKRTSISLIKCKKALIESGGNIELAIDNIRKSGLKIDLNRSRRLTPSGLIAVEITPNKQKGLMIEINCETDFVAKNSIFQEFIKIVVTTALNESINNINILQARFEKQRSILTNKIGENIKINKFVILTGNFLSSYVHDAKIGVIVSASGKINESVVKHIAMHIAARDPKYIYVDDIPEDIMRRERDIQMNIAIQSGKSDKISEKIVEGRIKKFISDIVLTKQNFIMDINNKVGSILDGYCIEIDNFVRFEIGND